ncbi:MAG: sigma 54-interacting transcriptional regulator, partial [Pseudomonadales bacterium]|nr:sigma 54-interacting transcriptional regulator [Pseudomonadales bacterium]
IKILRSLQEKVIERLGSNNLHKVDLQVIAASKVELRDNPDFRQDLFYRLSISELQIPALRERVEDIPLLFDHYLKLAVQQQAVSMRQLSADELRALMSYQWPGNVRELKNVALRYAVDTENSLMELLRPTSLSTAIGSEGDEQLGNCEVSPLAAKVASFEEQVIRMSLDKHCGNIKQTLLELDLPRRTLNQKMIRYGINRADYRND